MHPTNLKVRIRGLGLGLGLGLVRVLGLVKVRIRVRFRVRVKVCCIVTQFFVMCLKHNSKINLVSEFEVTVYNCSSHFGSELKVILTLVKLLITKYTVLVLCNAKMGVSTVFCHKYVYSDALHDRRTK